MADNLPIRFQEHLQLTSLGIDTANIAFATLTLESDKYICVRETEGDANRICIIDLENPADVVRRPITADSAIMNPIQKIIALKAGRQLQIFNLDSKTKVKAHAMAEDVVFWKWVSPTLIGLVTETAVYHWSMEGSGPGSDAPTKLFDRHPSLAGTQIINYRLNPDAAWMVLVGISAKDGRIVGAMQLYSRDRGVSQPIEGHAAAFAEIRLEGSSAPTKLFSFAVRTPAGAKLHIVEVDHTDGAPIFPKKAVDVFFPPEALNDFPVSMQVSDRYGVIYLVTKYGFIHLYDLETGTCIYMNRISADTIFVTAPHEATGGILGVNRKGQVLSVSVDEEKIIPYILNSLQNTDLAVRMASRAGLPGADDLYVQRFHQLFAQGNYSEAAKIAANSPRGILRTPETIEKFKHLPATQGQLSPILQYFGILLERDQLNKYESLELTRPVLAQGRKHLLEKWLKEDKLQCSEELGDAVRPSDPTLALSIYLRASVPAKAVQCMAEAGQYEKIVPYAQSSGFSPDFAFLLQQVLRSDPAKGATFASMIASAGEGGGSLVDLDRIVDVFLQANQIQQATSFLLDALKNNLPEQGPLQTRLLEMNLLHAPQVADAILGNEMFTHYDRLVIARLAEQAHLYQRALEHYTEPQDVRRVMALAASTIGQAPSGSGSPAISPEWLVGYFGRLSVETSLACLEELLRQGQVSVAVQVATRYTSELGASRLIRLFETDGTPDSLYYYLGSVVHVSQDPEVHFKYIQAAARTGQVREVERMCRESTAYDPERVKAFLRDDAGLEDQLPLLIVCDRYNFTTDLVTHLWRTDQWRFLEVYVQQVNPSRTPAVLGALLDLGVDEGKVRALLASVQPSSSVPVAPLVEAMEERSRLPLLLPWLEAMVRGPPGLTPGTPEETEIYNAVAKIRIDGNVDAERFLREDTHYDARVIGAYCQRRDPFLAVLAYERGGCDEELLSVTGDNGMFKEQARYLVGRRDLDLWARALSDSSPHRRAVVDQVASTALPESTDPEAVSVAVKALLAAGLRKELLEVLERLLLESSAFSDNTNLQNLLLLTAIKEGDASRVADYSERLSGYDAADVASIAVGAGMYEEALGIYRKYGVHASVVDVLLGQIGDVERAQQYVERLESGESVTGPGSSRSGSKALVHSSASSSNKTGKYPELWSRLGRARLERVEVPEAVTAFIRAVDASEWKEVVRVGAKAGAYSDLIPYLEMARNGGAVRDAGLEAELLFAYCKCERLPDAESFLSSGGGAGLGAAQIQAVGDRCASEGAWEAARILYTSSGQFGKLATVLVRLGDYQGAVEGARKAGSTRVWREVNRACVEEREWRLAQVCGLQLVVHAEELSGLVRLYEEGGYVTELMELLEAGLGLERAHMGMFTELAILYAKYAQDKVMGHLRGYATRINIPRVIRVCEDAQLWPELVFLYAAYDEFDHAVTTMINHSADAWEHGRFKDLLARSSSPDLLYRSLRFYLDESPTLICDLLASVMPRLDHARVVGMFERSDNLPLIRPYLVAVQATGANVAAVNTAMHELLIEEEEADALRESIDLHDNFDLLALAERLEGHELLAFRRIASLLYRRHRRWVSSIDLSKADRLFRDAMDTASASREAEVAESLIRYFVEHGLKEEFSAALYICYDLIRPDLAMELAWRHGLNDMIMPYMLQTMAEMNGRVGRLEKEREERLASRAAGDAKDKHGRGGSVPPVGGPLMITQGGFGGMPGSDGRPSSGGMNYPGY